MEKQGSILLVDDELDFLEVARAILKRKGYDVEIASSAKEAAERAKQHFFHAAVLDISLPDAEGTEVLSALRILYPDIIAVMLTGHSSVHNAVKSLNLGAFAYLEKPLAPDNLISVISRGLEKQRLVFENRQLLEQLQQRNHETSILLSVSQAVAQFLELEDMLSSALDKLIELLTVDIAYIFIREGRKLVLKGSQGFGCQLVEKLKESKPGDASSLTDAVQDALYPAEGERCNSHVTLPLTIAGGNIGIMGLATRTPSRFTQREMELLRAVSFEIAIAIHNAQLYEEASSARALRELDALRREFLSNISHELRTPLTIIKGYASTMLQPDVDFDQQALHDFLQSIDKEADRLNRLIADLLMASRIEAGALELRKEACCVPELLDSIRDRLDHLTTHHKLEFHIADNLPSVKVDKERLGEVLSNLVENAAKFSPEGTRIQVAARMNCHDVIMSVHDEGLGIPPEHHARLFTRFYRVDTPLKTTKKGTGLGLCICRGIVEAHGGNIWVESAPGSGAIFSFTLPVDGK